MFRVILAMISIVTCGVLVAALNSGSVASRFAESTPLRAQSAASDATAEGQLEAMVQKLRANCPVNYQKGVTLLDVYTDQPNEITARYVLQTQKTHFSDIAREGYRRLAIGQFQETGIGKLKMAQAIRWHYTYESIDGRPLFDFQLKAQNFLAGQQETSPSSTTSLAPTRAATPHGGTTTRSSRRAYPVADNNVPIRPVDRDKVIDAFFTSGSVFSPTTQASSRSGSTGAAGSPQAVQRNPFAK